MKLLTVNVHAWLEADQEDKLQRLARVIAREGYDIIALQEVNQSLNSPYAYGDIRQDNYGLLLMAALEKLGRQDYSYHWTFSHIGYGKYEEGLALLTRHPVTKVTDFYCSRSQKAKALASRKALQVRLTVGGEAVDCYSCHMNLPGTAGEDYLENVRRLLAHDRTDGLRLFMGDFNTDARSQKEQYEAIKALGLCDSYDLAQTKDSGITVSKTIDGWRESQADKRLDYIFLSQEREVLSSRVIFNGQTEAPISDHYGLEVRIGAP